MSDHRNHDDFTTKRGAEKREDLVAEAVAQWKSNKLGKAIVHMETVTALHRIRNVVVSRVERELKPLNLNFPQYEALTLLFVSSRGELPLGQMSKRLVIHPTTITNTIDQLEAKNFVERARSNTDRRLVLAKLTPLGRTAARKASTELDKIRYGLGEMDTEDAKVMADIMRAFRAQIHDTI